MESVLTVYNLLKQGNEKKSLSEYQQMIANKETLKLIHQILSGIMIIEEKHVRYLTTGFMFNYYTDQMIQNKELEHNKEFIQHYQGL